MNDWPTFADLFSSPALEEERLGKMQRLEALFRLLAAELDRLTGQASTWGLLDEARRSLLACYALTRQHLCAAQDYEAIAREKSAEWARERESLTSRVLLEER
jgi:hypothetical protein